MMKNKIYRRRLWKNRLATAAAILATGIGLASLCAVLFHLLSQGIDALSPTLFTAMTPPPGESGGLANAIVGSLILSGLAMLFAIPLGLMGGVYLAHYDTGGLWASCVRFVNDIMLSAPSICLGLFVYEIMVKPMHRFSAVAGAIALGLIAIPIILRTAEDMLRLVPRTLFEAAAALGAPPWHIICVICFQSARHGIVTGILLAFARIAGETAPLLFTALNNQFWSLAIDQPMASLPVTLFQFAMSPYDDWHRLASAGALIITLFVLFINIAARFYAARGQGKTS